jgi:transcriptional regulator with XRE-family HTH domain
MNQFADNLRQLRSDKEYKQADFAEKVGVHVTNLSKYERGKTLPSLEIAERMAQLLDVT